MSNRIVGLHVLGRSRDFRYVSKVSGKSDTKTEAAMDTKRQAACNLMTLGVTLELSKIKNTHQNDRISVDITLQSTETSFQQFMALCSWKAIRRWKSFREFIQYFGGFL